MLKNKKNNKDTHNRSRNKRILTIYSSQPSLPQPLLKATSLPLKKIPKHSITNVHPKHKQLKKDKPKVQPSHPKAKPIQIYERIPMNFAQSNSNSEIQFSNYDETTNQPRQMRKSLFINCDQQALIQQIWRMDKKKKGLQHKAATKIQKVFRGYLTRKLLMRYVQEYEQKLLAEKQILQKKTSFKSMRDNQDCYVSLKSSYFPSNRKDLNQEIQNPLDKESAIKKSDRGLASIMKEEHIRHEDERQQRRGSQAEPSSMTLNQSSISARVQQISLSFGQDGQPSPHFTQQTVTNRPQAQQYMISPTKPSQNILTHVSNDKTRDAISQNISNSASYSKPNKQDHSHFSSVIKQDVSWRAEAEGVHLEKLRSTQKAKWEQVIQFVNHQLKQGLDQQKTKELMSTILSFSVKNREELNNKDVKANDLAEVTPTTMTHREQQEPLPFRKKKYREEEQEKNQFKIAKNQHMPLLKTIKQPESLFDRTSNLKQHFLRTINFQDEQIDKMMQLREAVLRKKETHSLVELQHLLENNMLTQQEFLDRLSTLTRVFSRQKKDMEQAKNDIYQGYKAQFQLLKFTCLDAKYLGYQLPFCRSMEIFPSNSNWRFDQVMIDQLNQLANRKANKSSLVTEQKQPKTLTNSQINAILEGKADEQQQRQDFDQCLSVSMDKSVSFQYEQANVSRKCQPFSMCVSLSEQNEFMSSPRARRNSFCISDRLAMLTSQQSKNVTPCKNQKQVEGSSEEKFARADSFRRETYQISGSDEEEEVLYKEAEESLNMKIVQISLSKLIWEMVEDIYSSSTINKALGKGKSQLILQPISKQQKLSFLDLVVSKVPGFELLRQRLNQKMYPNAKQLMMSMRELSDVSSDQPEYFQIGQYEYIFNQEICYEVIENYLHLYRQQRKQQTQNIQQNYTSATFREEYDNLASDRLKKIVSASAKAQVRKTQENEELREEIVKIQLHLLLDSWNEELIRYRENKNGYSGIGLNELTLSLIDRQCRPMQTQSELSQMLNYTKDVLTQTIREDKLNDKLMKQYEQSVSHNDSQWILYSQQALQFGFQIAMTVEMQLIFETLQDLHHINERTQSSWQHQYNQLERDSQSSEEDRLQLNEQEAEKLQRKMSQMKRGESDSDDSFYD